MYMLQFSLYHTLLRISLVVGAFVLVFQSGVVSNTTALLAQNTQSYLANAVGVSVGVVPTDLNQITAALTEQKQQLDAREATLREREITVGLNGAGVQADRTTFILSAMLFMLLCLIILNYALDFIRLKQVQKLANAPSSGYSLQ